MQRADRLSEAAGRSQAHAATTRASKRSPSSRPARYKGSVVAFAERFTRGSGYHTGWIWVGGGEPQRFQLQDIDGFNITDAAGLADGSLLVLERYFRWTEGVKMRLRHIAAGEIAPARASPGARCFEADSELRDRQHGGPGRAPRARAARPCCR